MNLLTNSCITYRYPASRVTNWDSIILKHVCYRHITPLSQTKTMPHTQYVGITYLNLTQVTALTQACTLLPELLDLLPNKLT